MCTERDPFLLTWEGEFWNSPLIPFQTAQPQDQLGAKYWWRCNVGAPAEWLPLRRVWLLNEPTGLLCWSITELFGGGGSFLAGPAHQSLGEPIRVIPHISGLTNPPELMCIFSAVIQPYPAPQPPPDQSRQSSLRILTWLKGLFKNGGGERGRQAVFNATLELVFVF